MGNIWIKRLLSYLPNSILRLMSSSTYSGFLIYDIENKRIKEIYRTTSSTTVKTTGVFQNSDGKYYLGSLKKA
jgi:hypothetical protein